MYRRFGSEVTVIEKGPRLASREDPDVSEAIKGILEAEGVTVRLGAECLGVTKDAGGIRVRAAHGGDAKEWPERCAPHTC